jgi:hypothetical protein
MPGQFLGGCIKMFSVYMHVRGNERKRKGM